MPFDGGLRLQLMRAVAYNKTEEACQLLQEHAKKIELPEETSPLVIASSEPDGIFILKYFVEKVDMDVNTLCPKTGLTPLVIACRKGHLENVKYLMQRPDINPNLTTVYGLTPIMAACLFTSNIEVFKQLLAHEQTGINEFDIDPKNNTFLSTPFMILLALRKIEIANLLINDERFKVKNVLKDGETELHQVIGAHYPDENLRFDHIKKLIALGADPSLRLDQRHFNYRGNSNSIEEAREAGFNEIADYLEKVRIEQSNNRYKDLRTKSLDPSLDRKWQENPERIYDSLEGLAQYRDELRVRVFGP